MSDKILIPLLCYNYGRFLPECLESILRQTHKNWKIVVRDPGSTDNTKKVMSYYTRKDSRISYIREKGPLKIGTARNRTIKENPDFTLIAYHDVDDIMIHDRLELSIKALSDSHIVYGNSKNFGLRHNIITSFPYVNFKLLLQQNIIIAPTVCFRSNVWRYVGGFDENMHRASDYDFWIRVAKAGFTFKYLNQILTLYRIHSKSITPHQSRSIAHKLAFVKEIEIPDVAYARNKHTTEHRDTKAVILLSFFSIFWRRYKSISERDRVLNLND